MNLILSFLLYVLQQILFKKGQDPDLIQNEDGALNVIILMFM